MKTIKWVQIGFRFKEWLITGIFGVLMLAAALLVLLKDLEIGPIQIGVSILLAIIGVYSLIECLKRIFVKFVSVYSNGILKSPSNVQQIGDILYKRKVLAAGPKIVVIGGGTGISTLLRGLKQYSSNITAIITVADDGGGSGALRTDLGMLPPGDIRNCLLALAETEPVLEKLLDYRFTDGSLKGQSFGNLFLAAMCGISGSFEQAVRHMGEVLAVTGRVYPVTEENVYLVAELEDGTVIRGESRIGAHHTTHPGKIRRVSFDKPKVKPLPAILDAIRDADMIVLGPGSLYTSIIPNFLVEGMGKALESAMGLRLYACNIMTQPGETDGYTVGNHLEALFFHAGSVCVDYCLVNSGKIKAAATKKYLEDGAEPVMVDLSHVKRMGIRLIEKDLVKLAGDYVRHDPEKLAQAIMDIYKAYGHTPRTKTK